MSFLNRDVKEIGALISHAMKCEADELFDDLSKINIKVYPKHIEEFCISLVFVSFLFVGITSYGQSGTFSSIEKKSVGFAAVGQTQTAPSVEVLQAQIAKLLAEIEFLKAQLGQQQTNPSSAVRFCFNWTRNLRIGDRGNDVAQLVTALTKEGFLSDKSDIFDEEVASAVVGFQEKNASEVLKPNGLARGTGYVGAATRARLNALYRCDNVIPEPKPSVSEEVKCVFSGATTEQRCYASNNAPTETPENLSFGCSGVGSCVAKVQGSSGTALTWKSSCGGYAYTRIDGQFEYANFSCGTSQPSASITVLSPSGGVYDSGGSLKIQWTSYSGDFDYYQLVLGNTIANAEIQIDDGHQILKHQNSYNTFALWSFVDWIAKNSGGISQEKIKDAYYVKVHAIKADRVSGGVVNTGKSSIFSITPRVVPQPPKTVGSCTDSDGGKNTEVVGLTDGRVNGIGSYFRDISVTSNGSVCSGESCTAVAEGYCTDEGRVTNILIPCASGYSKDGACVPKAITPPPVSSDILSVSLIGASEDKAGTNWTFGPGSGVSGGAADWKWVAKLGMASGKAIQWMLLKHNIPGEAWSTSAEKSTYGKELYPLVVYQGSTQLNTTYDQQLGNHSTTEFTLYGQAETRPFAGGTLVIYFTDGTSISASIPSASITPTNMDGVNFWIHEVNEDRAGTNGVFGPGVGVINTGSSDWKWKANIYSATTKTIKSISVIHNVPGEAWSTSADRSLYGKELYPLVAFDYYSGQQINTAYDQTLGTVGPGSKVFNLYGQRETTPFAGAKIIIYFTDGTSVTTSMPARSWNLTSGVTQ